MIKPYFETELGKLYHRDCLIAMSGMQDNSIDLLVTDPPYGYSFMDKDWDKAVIGVDIWKECLRILKPGAFAFIMSAPRQDVLSRMIVNLQDAGFMTGFTSLYWTYASGFPKAGNTSRMIDRRLGAEREVIGKRKNIGHIERGDSNISEQINYSSDGWFTSKDLGDITAPVSPQAKALDGSYLGFQPKPAVEVIIVCMKPLSEKSYIDQAMKDGKGIVWFDDCRIPFINNQEDTRRKGGWQLDQYVGGKEYKNYPIENQDDRLQGRFPANLLVSDDVLNDGRVSNNYRPNHIGKITGSQNFAGRRGIHNEPNDTGSFSRYFDLDKWWAEQIKKLPKSVQKTFPFLIVPKASRAEKNKGCEGLKEVETMYGSGGGAMPSGNDNPDKTTTKNNHPTVKPLKLFAYLLTLGSRANDVIIDLFIGSGTMAVACEDMNRKWIGIDLDEEYCKIAVERIKKETVQLKLPI